MPGSAQGRRLYIIGPDAAFQGFTPMSEIWVFLVALGNTL